MNFPLLTVRKALVSQMLAIRKLLSSIQKRRKKYWYWSITKLRTFPKHTLGASLARFLDKHQLAVATPFERHDIYRVLLNYGMDIEQEIEMLCFLYANGKKSLDNRIIIISAYLFLPEYWSHFKRAFYKGKQAVNLCEWDFRYLLAEPIDVLQRHIFRQVIEEPPLFI